MRLLVGTSTINLHAVAGMVISGLGWFINAGGLTALNQHYPSLGPVLGVVGLIYAAASGKLVAKPDISTTTTTSTIKTEGKP